MAREFLTDVDVDGNLTVDGKNVLTEADTQELLAAILEQLFEMRMILYEGLHPKRGRDTNQL